MDLTVIMWKKFKRLIQFFQYRREPDKLFFKPFAFSLGNRTLQVMRAKVSDIQNLLLLENKVYSGNSPWSEEVFQSELYKKRSLYLVVYEASVLIALIGMRVGKREAHITNVAVLPDWQGCGLGTELMQLMIDFAEKQGCQWLSLEVRIDNDVAKGLYESLGFVPAFVRPNYYQDVHKDGLNMVLKLKPSLEERN